MQLPQQALLRLPQIIGTPAKGGRPAVPGLIPVGKSTWWNGVRSGRYPQPVKISERCTAWRASDIYALIEGAKAEAA
jgi:predicted DNA-binding transcriptional regulator AlpA